LGNIEALLRILRRNNITLVSAFPDPDAEVLALFRRRFSVEEGRRLLETRLPELDEEGPASADANRVASLEARHV
ncbi:ATP-binding protein, partial [Lamprobacter modestohalophilus]